jgi:hypothetical protein
MKHLIGAGFAAALLFTAGAGRAADPKTYVASAFTIGGAETPTGQELTAKPGQPLMTRPFWSETAARLTFLGINPDGSIRYLISAVAPNETIKPVVDAPVAARSSTITIPIPIGR